MDPEIKIEPGTSQHQRLNQPRAFSNEPMSVRSHLSSRRFSEPPIPSQLTSPIPSTTKSEPHQSPIIDASRAEKPLLEKASNVKPELKSEENFLYSGMTPPKCKTYKKSMKPLDTVLEKELDVALGEFYLTKLTWELGRQVENFPEFQGWLDEITNILTRNAKPQVMIGLYGGTGVGKSSVLNALLDKNLLHCNPMRAGTSVVTQVSYNFDEDKDHKYKAEIETITPEEWREELEILFSDIRDEAAGYGVAIAKIRAVYPDVNIDNLHKMSAAQLVAKPATKKVLGTTHCFEATSMVKLQSAVNQFTNSRVAEEGNETEYQKPAFWPLVRIHHIYYKAEWLRPGIVLVDLPGVADSNAARCKVAEGYIKNLNAVWVVAPINRGVDDKTASDLLDQSFKTQAKLDGKLSQQLISFVMTRCDDINVGETARELGLKTERWWKEQQTKLREITSEVTTKSKLQTKLKNESAATKHQKKNIDKQLQLMNAKSEDQNTSSEDGDTEQTSKRRHVVSKKNSSIKKRKIDDKTAFPAQNTPQTVEDLISQRKEKSSQTKKLEKQIIQLENEINNLNVEESCVNEQKRHFCIKERNKWSMKAMRNKFAQELRDFEAELINEGDEETANFEKKSSTEKVEVFCVSSKAFNQLQGRNKSEKRVDGFFNIEDTNIPQLRNHCVQMSLLGREKVADAFLKELELLNESIHKWATDTSPETQISQSQKILLEGAFKKHSETLKQTMRTAEKKTVDSIRWLIGSDMESVLEKAALRGIDTSEKIVESWFIAGNDKINGATFKALCSRRGGPHTNNKKITYNLNDLLANKFLTYMTKPWDLTFHTTIPRHIEPHQVAISSAFDSFSHALSGAVAEIHPDMLTELQHVLSRMPHVKHTAKVDVTNAFDTFEVKTRDISRIPPSYIQKALQNTYRECAEETGPGCQGRVKDRMIHDNNEHKHTIYPKMAGEMMKQLKSTVDAISSDIKEPTNKALSKIAKSFKHILDNAIVSERVHGQRPEKSALQHIIIAHLNDLEKAFSGDFKGDLVFITAKQIEEISPRAEKDLGQVDRNDQDGNDSNAGEREESSEEEGNSTEDYDGSKDETDRYNGRCGPFAYVGNESDDDSDGE